MSVRARLDDAAFLLHQGRFDGALLSTLIGIAATSRKRYPKGTQSRLWPTKEMRDGEAFTWFLSEEFLVVTSGVIKNLFVKFRGKEIRAEKFFYKYLRCELVHNATFPRDVRFLDDEAAGFQIRVSDTEIGLSKSWQSCLAKCVQFAPENLNDFPEFAKLPDDVLRWIIFEARRDSENSKQYWTERESRISSLV